MVSLTVPSTSETLFLMREDVACLFFKNHCIFSRHFENFPTFPVILSSQERREIIKSCREAKEYGFWGVELSDCCELIASVVRQERDESFDDRGFEQRIDWILRLLSRNTDDQFVFHRSTVRLFSDMAILLCDVSRVMEVLAEKSKTNVRIFHVLDNQNTYATVDSADWSTTRIGKCAGPGLKLDQLQQWSSDRAKIGPTYDEDAIMTDSGKMGSAPRYLSLGLNFWEEELSSIPQAAAQIRAAEESVLEDVKQGWSESSVRAFPLFPRIGSKHLRTAGFRPTDDGETVKHYQLTLMILKSPLTEQEMMEIKKSGTISEDFPTVEKPDFFNVLPLNHVAWSRLLEVIPYIKEEIKLRKMASVKPIEIVSPVPFGQDDIFLELERAAPELLVGFLPKPQINPASQSIKYKEAVQKTLEELTEEQKKILSGQFSVDQETVMKWFRQWGALNVPARLAWKIAKIAVEKKTGEAASTPSNKKQKMKK